MGCNTINKIPRTYEAWFTTTLSDVGCLLTRIGRGFGLVVQIAMLVHTEATHQTKSTRVTITIKPTRFTASITAKPIH